MRVLLVLSFIFIALISNSARADVLYIDLFNGGEPGTQGFTIGNACGHASCLNDTTFSPVHDLPGGSTVDFGQVTFFTSSLSSQISATRYLTQFFTGAIDIRFGQFDSYLPLDASLNGGSLCYGESYGDCPAPPPYTVHLIFTLPSDASRIQVALAGRFEYLAPAIPELSTWSMMLLGFCGFGLLLHRQRADA